MNPRRYHECVACGTETKYHVVDHDSRGHLVTAYCPDCEQDTRHKIGGF